jgi:hypothetical protein
MQVLTLVKVQRQPTGTILAEQIRQHRRRDVSGPVLAVQVCRLGAVKGARDPRFSELRRAKSQRQVDLAPCLECARSVMMHVVVLAASTAITESRGLH